MAKGTVVKRGDKTWLVGYDVGTSSDGKRIRKWKTVHGSKDDADRELRSLLTSLDTGTYVEPSKMTVAQYLRQWLEDVARPKTENKTFEVYSEIVNKHLIPAFGHHQLQKLHPMHIQSYYAHALRSGRKDKTGGLSEQTVLHHHRVLSNAMKAAVRLQLLARNPAEAVEAPKPEKDEMVILSEEQAGKLLELVAGSRLHMPVLIALMTGMRRGEILALRWKDVDLNKKLLTVRQAVEDTRAGITIKAPKTRSSRRTIPLPDLLVDELRRHQTDQKKQRLAVGALYQNNDLVCARDDGRIMDPSEQLTRAFAWLWGGQRTNRKTATPDLAGPLGIPKCRFHDLRHTHASLLIKQGVHMKVISERLGHGSIGITMDTYGHLLPGVQEQAMVQFDATMRSVIQHKRA